MVYGFRRNFLPFFDEKIHFYFIDFQGNNFSKALILNFEWCIFAVIIKNETLWKKKSH